MRQSIALIAMLSSMTIAADTIQFFYPGGVEGVDPVATIKNAQPTVTEFNLACPTNVDSTECGFGPGMNYTILSKSIYKASMSYDEFDFSLACDYNTQASEATCTVSMSGGNAELSDLAGPQTAVLSGGEALFNTALIVEGANLLSGGAASATPSATPAASAGTSGASSTPTGTGAQASKSATSGVASSGTGTASPAEQTGAATMVGMHSVAVIAFVAVAAICIL